MSAGGVRAMRSALPVGFFSGSSRYLFTRYPMSPATTSRQIRSIWQQGFKSSSRHQSPLFFQQNSGSSRATAQRSWFTIRNSPLLRRLQSTKPPTPGKVPVNPPVEKPSLSQRLKKLSREYGWSAVGVYLTLSVLDFPVCYLIVKGVGVDRIGAWEEKVVHFFWSYIPWPFPGAEKSSKKSIEAAGDQVGAHNSDGWEIKKDVNKGEGASIWTVLALAYAIHKSVFIFFRVPATAAITPKVVKTLRGWGWDIGKRRPTT